MRTSRRNLLIPPQALPGPNLPGAHRARRLPERSRLQPLSAQPPPASGGQICPERLTRTAPDPGPRLQAHASDPGSSIRGNSAGSRSGICRRLRPLTPIRGLQDHPSQDSGKTPPMGDPAGSHIGHDLQGIQGGPGAGHIAAVIPQLQFLPPLSGQDPLQGKAPDPGRQILEALLRRLRLPGKPPPPDLAGDPCRGQIPDQIPEHLIRTGCPGNAGKGCRDRLRQSSRGGNRCHLHSRGPASGSGAVRGGQIRKGGTPHLPHKRHPGLAHLPGALRGSAPCDLRSAPGTRVRLRIHGRRQDAFRQQ